MLVGAEEVLARLYHEHTKSKLYTPLGLGEHARQGHEPVGADAGSERRQRGAGTTPGARRAGCQLRARVDATVMMAVMDGADAAKWAFILVASDRGGRRAVRRVVYGESQVTPRRPSPIARLLVRLCLEDRAGYEARDVIRRSHPRHDGGRHRLPRSGPGPSLSSRARADVTMTRLRRPNALPVKGTRASPK